jgi:hypothetical protein
VFATVALTAGVPATVTAGSVPTFTVGVFTTLTFCVGAFCGRSFARFSARAIPAAQITSMTGAIVAAFSFWIMVFSP